MSQCRSCKAPIFWINSFVTGRPMPIDAQAEKRIVVVVTETGEPLEGITSGISGDVVGRVVSVYRSHFATCPNAAQHRKGGGAGG